MDDIRVVINGHKENYNLDRMMVKDKISRWGECECLLVMRR